MSRPPDGSPDPRPEALTSPAEHTPVFEARPGGYWWYVWQRFRANPAATVSAAYIAFLVVIAIFAGVIAPYGPSDQHFPPVPVGEIADPSVPRETGRVQPPSWDHWFGTDQLARDIFSRTLIGLRVSLGAAVFAVVVVTLLGISVGTAAAWGPRGLDALLMRVTDIAFAFPALILVILLSFLMGNEIFGMRSILGVEASVLLLFLAIALTLWPTTARLVRGQLLVVRELEYIVAARALGAGPWRLALRHALPNVLGPVVVSASFLVPAAITFEATLSFIGIGVAAPTPSLGSMIEKHQEWMTAQWTGVAIPTALLVSLFLAFQFMGDGLRDALDPRALR